MASHSRGRVTALSVPLAMAALAYAAKPSDYLRGALEVEERTARVRVTAPAAVGANATASAGMAAPPSASATARRFEPDPCRDRNRGDACSTELAPDGFCSEAYSAADVENAASSSHLFCKRKGPVREPFALLAV